MAPTYSRRKVIPLTKEEIKKKYKDIKEELQEVLDWKDEEESKINNLEFSPQKRGAAKRALKKAEWRINTVKGQIIYWGCRVKGESHFKASIEKNEYWAKCMERKDGNY